MVQYTSHENDFIQISITDKSNIKFIGSMYNRRSKVSINKYIFCDPNHKNLMYCFLLWIGVPVRTDRPF